MQEARASPIDFRYFYRYVHGMAVVLKGLVFALGTVPAVHLLSHRHHPLDFERLSYVYLTLTVFFSGIAVGSDDPPNWILGVGLWFAATGFGHAIRWQVERDFRDEQESV
jgi:hypothetical protein